MKRLVCCLAAIAALLFTACHNEEVLPTEGMGTVKFQVINYEQISLNEVTRATAATSLAHLEMGIYDAVTHELIDSVKTQSGDGNYGSFSATLPYGEYIVVFLGFEGGKASHLKNLNSIQFAENYVPNFFYKTLNLTVSPSTSGSQNIALARAVSAFKIQSEGYIPSNLSTMTIVAKGGGYVFNAETGLASSVLQKTSSYNVSSYAGKESIGMKINQRTTYTGAFFGDGKATSGFNLTLENDQWDDINHSY